MVYGMSPKIALLAPLACAALCAQSTPPGLSAGAVENGSDFIDCRSHHSQSHRPHAVRTRSARGNRVLKHGWQDRIHFQLRRWRRALHRNTLGVIDLVGQKALPSIDLGAYALVPTDSSSPAESSGSPRRWRRRLALTIQPRRRSISSSAPDKNRTHMLFVTADTWKRIVTSNVSSATMTFIDKTDGGARGPGGPPPGRGPRSDWTETVVPVGRGAEGFDVSPDGKEIWAANALDGNRVGSRFLPGRKSSRP